MISFTGTLEGKPFEGGSGEDVGVNVGSNTFIPGFEDQLIGMKAGEHRTVKVQFPTNYLSQELAGKDAEFQVTAKSIEAPGEITIDDAMAKTMGLESLEKMREAVKERITRDFAAQSRAKLKRALLDQARQSAQVHRAADSRRAGIQRGVEPGEPAILNRPRRPLPTRAQPKKRLARNTSEIADRRVRLGLVLAEIGEKNNIKVADEDLTRAVVERARQFPGQEQQVWDYYRKNPQAMAQLRAPLYEEKVVDFISELATVTDKKVTKDELFKPDDETEGRVSTV